MTLVFAAPFIGVLVLRAPVINQISYIDGWFYSGYGWSLTHGLRVFEDTYYGVRFPPILLIGGATDLFGPVVGFVVLRYLILLGTGVALYRCTRRFASGPVAGAAVVLLALDVYYLRLVLWDYVTFVQIPALLAAVAIWPRGAARWGLLPAAGAGALVCAAGFSTELSLLIVPPVLFVEFGAAARRRDGELPRLVARVGAAVAGAAALFAVGWFVYWLVAGFSPNDMVRPTINFIKHGTSGSFVEPVKAWIFKEPRIYAPLVLVLGMVLIARGRLLGTDLVARLGQFSLLFVAELWLYRFAANDSIVETWWAYGVTAVPMAFAGAIILAELDRLPQRGALAIVAALVAAALSDLIIRLLGGHAINAYDKLRGHYWRELVVVLVGLAGLVFWPRLKPVPRTLAVTVLLVVVTGLSLTPAVYFGVGQTGEFSDTGVETDAYSDSYALVHDVDAQDSPASRTLVWFPASTGLLASTWSVFPSIGGSLGDYLGPIPLTRLSDTAKQRLAYPTTARVLVVSPDARDLVKARATLRAAGYSTQARPSGSWAGGLHHQILQVRALPAGGSRQAVRVAVGATLAAWGARNTHRLCGLTYPSLSELLAIQHRTCPAGVARALEGTAPPPGPITSIRISDDVAHVTLAGASQPMMLDLNQSEWTLVSGVPWLA